MLQKRSGWDGSGRILYESHAPVTQSVKSVAFLLNYLGKPSNPLPESVELPGATLVLSGKRDSYYVVTPKDCSCPSRNWRPGQRCKHMRRYSPQSTPINRQSMAETLQEADQNLPQMPKRYQAMVQSAREAAEDDPETILPRGKWAGGHNGPVEVD